MVDTPAKELVKHIRKRIIQEYAFELCFTAMNYAEHDSTNLKHKIVPYNCPYKIKCPNCEKYVPAKRFTEHLGRCVKKYKEKLNIKNI